MDGQLGKFEIFFDGQCPLCRREIDWVRRRDKQCRMIFTDIADSKFQPDKVPLDRLMREIHGRHADGRVVTGVEVFREIYQRIGFAPLVAMTRWPILRSFLDWLYRGFAFVRYQHARHRLRRCRSQSCGWLSDTQHAVDKDGAPPANSQVPHPGHDGCEVSS